MPQVESPFVNLLLEWPAERSPKQWAAIYGVSCAINLLFLLILVNLPAPPVDHALQGRVVWNTTPLYLPRDLLTQRAPNRQKAAKQVSLESLLASERHPSKASAPPAANTRRAEAPKPAPQVQMAQAVPQIAAEPPKAPVSTGRSLGVLAPAPPPPQPAKNPFQEVGSEAAPSEHPTLAPPKAGVQAAIQELAKGAASKQVVTSNDSATRQTPGGIGGHDQTPAQQAAVELKSDPQGADLRPYLIRILAIVRANWRTVTPESVRLGTRHGCTVMEFAINRDGSIPKMVVAEPSGSDPLDRAAAAGLMMSNPLPPLPAEYRGMQMRLAFSFSYNLPKGSCGG